MVHDALEEANKEFARIERQLKDAKDGVYQQFKDDQKKDEETDEDFMDEPSFNANEEL